MIDVSLRTTGHTSSINMETFIRILTISTNFIAAKSICSSTTCYGITENVFNLSCLVEIVDAGCIIFDSMFCIIEGNQFIKQSRIVADIWCVNVHPPQFQKKQKSKVSTRFYVFIIFTCFRNRVRSWHLATILKLSNVFFFFEIWSPFTSMVWAYKLNNARYDLFCTVAVSRLYLSK